MIEMSVDKETALPGNGRGDPMAHGQTQHLSECAKNCSDASRASAVAAPSSLEDSTSYAGAAFSGSVVLTERLTDDAGVAGGCSRTESAGMGAQLSGNHLRPKNGLQQPPPQQQQQQKLGKRRYSVNMGFKHPGFSKRRRRANSQSDPVLPTNFLLGGNIFDPLNLNSLLDEEVNRALNAETPKSSPLPAKSRDPVEILIPKDITDPLNLNSTGGDGNILASPLKSGGRKRHRNRHHGGGGGGGAAVQLDLLAGERGKAGEGGAPAAEAPKEGSVLLNLTPVPESPRPYELNTSINCRDEVVPPILPRSRPHPALGSAPPPQVQGPAGSGSLSAPSQASSSRCRKRRRTSSRSDSTAPTSAPAPPTKKGSTERGRGPGAGRRLQTFHTPVGGSRAGSVPMGGRSSQQPQRGRRKQQRFQYGNYNRYYGYRNPGLSEDPRVCVLRPEWFRGKAVLDLGCNTGHLTLTIAKNWHPARILGLDIDSGLVRAARQNVRHYLSELEAHKARRSTGEGRGKGRGRSREWAMVNSAGEEQKATAHTEGGSKMEDKQEVGASMDTDNHTASSCPTEGTEGTATAAPPGGHLASPPFPVSLRICRGPIAAPPLLHTATGDFPANVSFLKGNYVLESDALLQTQQPEYDVILCLSLTKWVHLNWGDVGLQRLFKRAFRHLRPGGIFILEPQPWASYSKRKKLTETTYKNYYNIRFKPDQFSSYLTSEVGFSSYELIGTPTSSSRGFQRPIYLFHKGPSSTRK
ncbi:7SK snRNA methylphosphate capping enzyme isoform X2 [Megalops cyprinoides]|nr:7SK snRNA methylphosphate capping enzyme isoform X2 [Megalops cyprinoides]XP_036404109.1 7SK snRNA methylphosphate capping enzyme isoform X2 [Megalops cyprinoides]